MFFHLFSYNLSPSLHSVVRTAVPPPTLLQSKCLQQQPLVTASAHYQLWLIVLLTAGLITIVTNLIQFAASVLFVFLLFLIFLAF